MMLSPETISAYEGKSREDLIAELERLKSQQAKVQHDEIFVFSDNDPIRQVLDRISDLVYYADISPSGEKTIRYIGPQLTRVLGLTHDQYIAERRDLLRYCHPDDVPGIVEAAKKLRYNKQQVNFIYRFHHQVLREYIWLEETVYPQSDNDGNTIAHLGITRDITSRMQTEENLRVSNQRMKLISESSPVGVFITDLNGKPVYVNRRAEEISELPAEKILQHAWYRKIHKEDAARLFRTVRDAVKNHTDYSAEFRFTSDDSKTRWVKMNVRAIRVSDDEVTGWVGIVEDITAAKESEMLLSESQKEFSAVLEGVKDVLYYRDWTNSPKATVRFISSHIYEVLGLTQEQYINHEGSFLTYCHPDDVAEIKERSQKLLREKKPVLFEYRFMHQVRKEYVWIEETVYPRYENGKYVASFGITRDVTERKLAEQKTRENEQLMAMVFNTIDDVIYFREVRGENKRFVVSDGIERLTGLTKQQYLFEIKEKLHEIVHPDDFGALKQVAEKLVAEKKAQTVTYRMRNVKTGEYKWMEERVVPSFDNSNNNIVAIFGVIRDVDERKIAEEQLRKSQDSLNMVLGGIDDVVYFADYSKGRRDVHFVSSNIEKVFGIPREDYTAGIYQLIEYCHPDDHDYILNRLDEMSREQAPKTFEYRFRHLRTGEYIWIEERIYPQFNGEGKMIANFGVSRDVTVRKMAEQKLLENEKTLSTVLSNVDEVVHYHLRKDVGTSQLIFVSDKIESVLGISKDEYGLLTPEEVRKLCHPDDLPVISAMAQNLVNTKKPQTAEYRFFNKKTGEYLWVEERLAPILDESGNYEATIGVTRDITSRRVAEQRILDSEEKFRMLAENASDIIYRYALNPEPHYEYVSPSAEAITGYTPEEYYQDPYLGFKIVHPDDAPLVQLSAELLQSGVSLRPEQVDGIVMRWVKKSGEMIWAETRNRPVFDADGKMIAIEGISRDITRQKTDEDALRESEERFRLLSKAAIEGILLIESGRVVDANDRFLNIFGYASQDELIGKPVDMVIMPQQIGTLPDVSGNGETSAYEIKCRRRDGSEIFIEARGHDIPFAGKMVRILTINDITERREAEQKLRESERALSTLMANLPGMAYRCAHDELWTMLFVSEGCEELTGYQTDDLVANRKKSFSEIVHPKDRAVGREQINIAIKNRQRFEIQYRIISAQGKVKWVWEKGEGVFDNNGALLFLEGFITDITERKEFEIEVLASRENYKNLIDKSPDGIILMKTGGELIYMNHSMSEMMGVDQETDLDSEKFFGFILPSYRDITRDHIAQVIKGRDMPFYTIEARSSKGPLLQIETKTILYDYLGEPALLIFARNVTAERLFEKEQLRAELAEESNRKLQEEINERIRTEKQLEAAQKYTRLLIESSLDMICASDKSGTIIEFNLAAQKTFGYTAEEIIGKPVWMLYENPDQRIGVMDDIISGSGIFSGEVINKKKNGETFTAFLSASVLRNENGEIIGAMGVSRDITPIKNAQEQIRRQAAKINSIFESSTHHIWTIDRNYCFSSYNENMRRWVHQQYGVNPHIGMNVISGPMYSTEEYNNFWKEKIDQAFNGEAVHFEIDFSVSGSQRTWREVYFSPIEDEKGYVEEIACIAHDITDKKQADERIRLSLKEKEVLLKEVHHRVKNNLQVISSILNLQSSYVKDQKTLELLRESQNRIKSMAFVHESLYQTKDFSSINFSEYVNNISTNLVHSYSNIDNPPELVLKTGKNIALNLDTAIPCGLIINELLSNAMKYAFTPEITGKIVVEIKASGNDLTIIISDNGRGLPDNIDFRNTESLGLQLVVTLVEQINGKIKLDNKKGTKFTIEFTLPHT